MSIFTISLDDGGPRAHDHDPIRQLDGLVDIVGHKNNGLALRLPDAQQFSAHDQARNRIERSKWLVQIEHVWIDGQRAGHFQSLLHAAGKFGRVGLFEPALVRPS